MCTYMCIYVYMYIHIYIYIYIYMSRRPAGLGTSELRLSQVAHVGWHYLSNATCLTRPHLFYAYFVVPRIAILCYILRHL